MINSATNHGNKDENIRLRITTYDSSKIQFPVKVLIHNKTPLKMYAHKRIIIFRKNNIYFLRQIEYQNFFTSLANIVEPNDENAT
jgi:hypothetical protein